MKEKTKEKIGGLVRIIGDLPQAGFEIAGITSIVGGFVTGTIGAGVAALVYDWKLGVGLAGGGLGTAGVGLSFMIVYVNLLGMTGGLESEDGIGINKLMLDIEKYRKINFNYDNNSV